MFTLTNRGSVANRLDSLCSMITRECWLVYRVQISALRIWNLKFTLETPGTVAPKQFIEKAVFEEITGAARCQ